MSVDDFSKQKGVKLENVPMPPTSNGQYATIIRCGRPFHVASHTLKTFQNEMKRYGFQNHGIIKFSQELIQQWLGAGYYLEIETIFFFQKKKLFSQKEKAKKLDVSNRLKAVHDLVAALLGIDDCLFFSLKAEKRLSLNGLEYCEINVIPTCIKS